MTDLHEPLEPLESYPDALPPHRQRGEVNLVGLLNVWDDTTRREIVEDGTTGCVTHTVEAARRTIADPASRKILLAFVHVGEGTAVARDLGLGPRTPRSS